MDKLLLVSLCCLGRIQDISSDKIDWCALSCNGEQNTMCKYSPKTSAGSCTNIVMATNPAMRKDLLHMHNEYRNKIANGEIVSNGVTWPKASDMREMSWDYDLEKLALRWVQQCSDSPPHDKCRRTPAFPYNGQNKGWEGHSNDYPSPYGSFQAWVGEISQANPGIVDSLGNFGSVLHFTQVIWAESYKLGCAAIRTDRQGFKTTILVCNYGPGGNMIGSKIYTRGEPCANCPAGTSCRSGSNYAQLCGSASDLGAPKDIPDSPDVTSGSWKVKLFGTGPENCKILIAFNSVVITFLAIKIV